MSQLRLTLTAALTFINRPVILPTYLQAFPLSLYARAYLFLRSASPATPDSDSLKRHLTPARPYTTQTSFPLLCPPPTPTTSYELRSSRSLFLPFLLGSFIPTFLPHFTCMLFAHYACYQCTSNTNGDSVIFAKQFNAWMNANKLLIFLYSF